MIEQGLYEAYKARRAQFGIANTTAAFARTCALSDIKHGRIVSPFRKRGPLGHGDVLRWRDANGERLTAVIAIVRDDCSDAPWEREDGHGEVTDWTSRAKAPGELVLNEDYGSYRYYDFTGACELALRDGWGSEPFDIPGETRKQRAARAARADYERLRRWCNDDWYYIGVCLFELPRDGVERDPEHIADAAPFGILKHAALWGIESDSPDYHETVARELMSEL